MFQAPSNKTKKHLCFLLHQMNLGGTERVLIDSIKLLSPIYEVTVVSLYREPLPSVKNDFEKAGARVVSPKLPEKPLFMFIPYLSRFYYEKVLKDINCDYLISINQAALNAGFVKKAKKTILWNHMDNVEKHIAPKGLIQKIRSCIFSLLHRRYDAVWAPCEKIKNDYFSAFKLTNACVLPNPLDCERINQLANLPCDITFDKDSFNVVAVGRFAYEKGMDRLVDIFINFVIPQHPKARLYLIGWGNDYDLLKEKIEKINAKNNIYLLGRKENPYNYIKQADLFVCPSRQESFGLVILEAMLLGVPVITTATTGGITTTQNGKYAVCTNNTEKDLKNALMSFMENPASYNYSLEDAKNHAQSYNMDAYKKQLFSLLNDLE